MGDGAPAGLGCDDGPAYLAALDAPFARAQWASVERHLLVAAGGLEGVREHPVSMERPPDMDSDRIVFGMGEAASGFAILAAASMGDDARAERLARSAWAVARGRRRWPAPRRGVHADGRDERRRDGRHRGWRWKLELTGAIPARRAVQAPAPPTGRAPPTFLRLVTRDDASGATPSTTAATARCELVLRDGRPLRFDDAVTPARLRALADALEVRA